MNHWTCMSAGCRLFMVSVLLCGVASVCMTMVTSGRLGGVCMQVDVAWGHAWLPMCSTAMYCLVAGDWIRQHHYVVHSERKWASC